MSNVIVSVNCSRRVASVAMAALGLLVTPTVATSQQLCSKAAAVEEVGADAYQFAGRIDQDGVSFTGYGYLYDIQGLAPNELFSDPNNPSESTAYFTYYATATLTSRATVTDPARAMFALDSAGEITFYYQLYPSASFDNPASFATGTVIAVASLSFQDILSVQSSDRGLSIGNGEFATITSDSFSFGGETLRFGHPGIVHQVSTFGDAQRTDSMIPQSSVLLAGNAVRSSFPHLFVPSVSVSK